MDPAAAVEFNERRRTSFGSVSELYEAARPSYPEQLVDAVLAYSELAEGARALEIGAGTGQATGQFAWRGLSVHAIEPSAQMAQLIAEKFEGTGLNVTVDASDFESAELEPAAYDLVFAPTSWHWLKPVVRWQRVAAAVRPGGTVAAFWNLPHWRRTAYRDELDLVYQRSGANLAELGPMIEAEIDQATLAREWMLDAPDRAAFTDLRGAEYRWSVNHSSEEYVALLGTYGDHLALAPEVREPLLDAVADVIDSHGGWIELPYTTHLLLARARVPQP